MTSGLAGLPDCEQFTAMLRDAGVLTDGSVRSVVVENIRPTILSQITRLRLEFDGDAADAPRSVICKTAHPERLETGWKSGQHEVAFYTQVAPATPARLLPRCFGADADAATRSWRIVLEDLSDTHRVASVWPLPPSAERCVQIVEARARFHAAWWDDSRLGISVGTWPGPEELTSFVQRLEQQVAQFVQRLGDALSDTRRELYRRLLQAAPARMAELPTRGNLTIAQGDAHAWNCFLPRDGGDDLRFFDWDSWRLGLGTSDLAYMIAVHWYPDLRARLEPLLLDRYHAALLAEGVQGYDRDDLQADYRMAVLWQALTPVLQAAYDIPPLYWWNNLERVMLAVEDLSCRELLG